MTSPLSHSHQACALRGAQPGRYAPFAQLLYSSYFELPAHACHHPLLPCCLFDTGPRGPARPPLSSVVDASTPRPPSVELVCCDPPSSLPVPLPQGAMAHAPPDAHHVGRLHRKT